MIDTRIKLRHVDSVARSKGFRRNQVRRVVATCEDANPRRGLMLIVKDRYGRFEGFYPDQVRYVSRAPTERSAFDPATVPFSMSFNSEVYAK